MTIKQLAIWAAFIFLAITSYLAIRSGMHRGDLVFRTALSEAEGGIDGALRRLGPAWDDPQGNLVRLSLNRTIVRSGKAIGRPPFQLDNSVLSHVKQVDSIRFLALGHQTRINDAGMAQIAEMKNLECLSMKQTKISTTGLQHLQSAKRLKVIVISDANLSEADAQAFEQAKPGCEVIRWPTDAGPGAAALTNEHNQFINNVTSGRVISAGDFHN